MVSRQQDRIPCPAALHVQDGKRRIAEIDAPLLFSLFSVHRNDQRVIIAFSLQDEERFVSSKASDRPSGELAQLV